MKVGYIRVSTQEQNTIRQEVLMQELGAEQIFIDRMSGKNMDRPELKREYILQRQREGIAIAKENGIYKGRKPIACTGFDSVLMLWRRREITAVEAQKRLGLSPSTFYRKIREYEKQIGKEEET